jgi:predicted Zn finger-like uncharacterized protein
MADERYTRCPGCTTIFRVTPQQLALRGGQVRCGHCKTVFDGNAELISLAPRRAPPPDDGYDEATMGPATVTLRSSQALLPNEPPEAIERTRDDDDSESPARVDYDDRFAWTRPKPRRPVVAVAYALAIPLLILLLAGQALFHFRDAIAAQFPAAKPALVRACATVGCTIQPLRDVAMKYLTFESSGLEADPAHKGLLVLSANMRSHAAWPLEYPYLEFSLTDAADKVVVRRALSPTDYADATADLARGIPANGEVAVKVFVDASATMQAGYRLYMFYP